MGTFISYSVSSNCILNEIISYEITIFDKHCVDKINNTYNTEYKLNISYTITETELNSIRSILRNYAGVWSV